MRDVLHYYWPTREAVREAIRIGSIPQWNAASHAGLPLLGDIHAAVLYFPNLLFQVVSYPRAYAWLVFVHQVVGSIGVTFLLRRLGMRGGAALLGGAAFELSGYVNGLTNAGPLMAGVAYVPWVGWTLIGSLPRLKKSLALAVLLALQSLTGDPQSVLFSLLLCVALVVWSRERASSTQALLTGTILSGLLAAIQLLPAWQLLQESTRSVAQPAFAAEEWSLHPVRLLEMAFAFPFGGYLEQPQFWAWFTVKGPGTIPFALSVYAGITALILAIFGLRRDRITGVGVSLVVVGALLALGSHGPFRFVLEHIPPFQFFRYPEKYTLLSALGIAILSAAGASRLFAGEVSRIRVVVIATLILGAGLLILLAAIARDQALSVFSRFLEASGTRGSPDGPLDSALSSASRTILFALLLLGAVVLSFRRKALSAPLVAAILVADLGLAASRVIWTGPNDLYSVRPPVADEVLAASPAHPFRMMRDTDSLNKRAPESRSMEGLIARRAWELATLKSNLGGVFGLEELSGYGAVRLARWSAVTQALASQPLKLAALFNGCIALSSDDSRGLSGTSGFVRVAVWPDLGLALFRAEPCVERLHAVNRVVGVASADEAVRGLQSNWDPSREALVEGETSSAFDPATLDQTTFDRQRISAQVTAPSTGTFLVFATAYYPGWKVWVDDVERPLRIVNGATMGARIPSGSHRVEFRFRDQMLTTGASVSALTALALLALLLKVRFLAQLRAKLSLRYVVKSSVHR